MGRPLFPPTHSRAHPRGRLGLILAPWSPPPELRERNGGDAKGKSQVLFCCHFVSKPSRPGGECQKRRRPKVEVTPPSCFKMMHSGLAFLEGTTPGLGKRQKTTWISPTQHSRVRRRGTWWQRGGEGLGENHRGEVPVPGRVGKPV